MQVKFLIIKGAQAHAIFAEVKQRTIDALSGVEHVDSIITRDIVQIIRPESSVRSASLSLHMEKPSDQFPDGLPVLLASLIGPQGDTRILYELYPDANLLEIVEYQPDDGRLRYDETLEDYIGRPNLSVDELLLLATQHLTGKLFLSPPLSDKLLMRFTPKNRYIIDKIIDHKKEIMDLLKSFDKDEGSVDLPVADLNAPV